MVVSIGPILLSSKFAGFFLFIHPIHRFGMMKNIADDLSRYGSDPSQLKILERRDFAIEDQKSTNYSIKTLRLKIVFKRS